jgi:uncharacterized membrane-anchored protein YitT (DUF2179 family)
MYQYRVPFYHKKNRRSGERSLYKRCFLILCGASLVAVSLQLFLVKNYVIDGGIVGISILLSQITNLEVGLLLFLLNSPFLVIGYSYLGRKFLILSLFAISVLSIVTFLLEPFPVLTKNPVLVILFGGLTLGIGVGLIIRYGGCLDGTEVLAILLSKRSTFSIGQYVMVFNVFIFTASIFIFGIKEAIYSLATFLVACKTIDVSIKTVVFKRK